MTCRRLVRAGRVLDEDLRHLGRHDVVIGAHHRQDRAAVAHDIVQRVRIVDGVEPGHRQPELTVTEIHCHPTVVPRLLVRIRVLVDAVGHRSAPRDEGRDTGNGPGHGGRDRAAAGQPEDGDPGRVDRGVLSQVVQCGRGVVHHVRVTEVEIGFLRVAGTGEVDPQRSDPPCRQGVGQTHEHVTVLVPAAQVAVQQQHRRHLLARRGRRHDQRAGYPVITGGHPHHRCGTRGRCRRNSRLARGLVSGRRRVGQRRGRGLGVR